MFDTTEELLRQIRLGEDSALELKDLRFAGGKVIGPHSNSMADELAAMANSSEGVFVLGVDDKTRMLNGIPAENLDIAETWVRTICNDLIEPPLDCRIRKIPVVLGGGDERVILRIDVPRSLFVHKSPDGYFRRIGSSKREMTPDVLARLFQQRSQARLIRYDEQAVPFAKKSHLSQARFAKFRSSLSPENEDEFLQKLKLMTRDEEGNPCPSVAGVLLVCDKPRDFIPNAYIQAVAYRGTDRNAAYQLDASDFDGPLDEQIADAYNFVRKNMRVYAVKRPAREDLPQYALPAVFEAIVNAVAHRDYSIYGSKVRLHLFADRLEIFSPGTISNTMTIDSLPYRQSARNELVAGLLAQCPVPAGFETVNRTHLMDKRGEGVPIILTESEKLSGHRPIYRLIDDAELMLTIFAATPNLTKEETI